MAFYHVRIILSDSRHPEGIREFNTYSSETLKITEQDQEAYAHFLSAAYETVGKDRVWGISCKRLIEAGPASTGSAAGAGQAVPAEGSVQAAGQAVQESPTEEDVPARVILKTKKGPGKYRSGPGGHPVTDWGATRKNNPSTP
jgi:hypothetical protein